MVEPALTCSRGTGYRYRVVPPGQVQVHSSIHRPGTGRVQYSYRYCEIITGHVYVHSIKTVQVQSSNHSQDLIHSSTSTDQYSQPTGTNQYSQPTGTNQYSQPTGTNQYSQHTGTNQYSQPTGTDQYLQPTGTDQYSQARCRHRYTAVFNDLLSWYRCNTVFTLQAQVKAYRFKLLSHKRSLSGSQRPRKCTV